MDGVTLGEGADAALLGPAVDPVAHREAGDGRADPDDLPREVVAQHERGTAGQERLEGRVAEPDVQRGTGTSQWTARFETTRRLNRARSNRRLRSSREARGSPTGARAHRHPSPVTRHPSPVTRHPSRAPADR
ncbi:hypothetical protein GCM10010282_53960 [Streptomyces roseolus]|nr:hypothetical protein GCM10010282_53960 [Streptomyces roseolus]